MFKSVRVIMILLTIALLASACVPVSQPAAQQAQNTQQSPADIQSEVSTAVAQTIEAQNQVSTFVAQTMQAQATATETATPFSIPTFTPFVVPTATHKSGGGGGNVVYKPDYACDIISRKPYDNTEIHHGNAFDIKWTIVNTGTKTWPAGVDVKYYSGPVMSNITFLEIPVEMAPGDKYQILMDANAPQELGFQVMTWVVSGKYCFPYTALIVK